MFDTLAGGGGGLPPDSLRRYALLADGERGALVGPRGAIAFLCAPRWHDDAVFSSLLGGRGSYLVTPHSQRYVWGGHYEPGTLIWRSRWVATSAVIECREALAFPGDPDRVVLLRRIEATAGTAHVQVQLECRANFGARAMTVRRNADDGWQGRTGDLTYRWSGAPGHTNLREDRLGFDLVVEEGESYDLVLEISRMLLPARPPDPVAAWAQTERSWRDSAPDLSGSIAPGDSSHSHAVLRGLTSAGGGIVAAATTSLPERAEQGRNYDYRFSWIRDQCYVGQAAAVVGSFDLLDSAVSFVFARVLADGSQLRPAYTVDGGPVPDERPVPLPGYPGAAVRVGNHVNQQFQLDSLGEALLLLSAADRLDRLESDGLRAIETLVSAIEERHEDPDAGIWELDHQRWAHSRLMCAAGLRAAAERRTGKGPGADWDKLADRLVESVNRDCLHPTGRWQRSPDDARVDAALLLPGIRGAVPAGDDRHLATVHAVVEELSDDGHVYRFRQGRERPLHDAEGAFLLCGFHLSLAMHQQGRSLEAVRWFERNRSAMGPPGLLTEEYDVVQRQLRGNLPQAFVHALLLETAHRLGEAGVSSRGFWTRDR
ncbi:MAG: glycoside hydrolase family 15 protein [Nocardioides sp.]